MTDTLFAAEAGEGPQTLVLLHGFAGSHRVWDRVGRALAPQARIIAYDLPGHAGSLHFPGAGHMLIDEAPDLAIELIRRQLR